MEDRINHLESVVAMQDHTITQLNAELFHQQRQLTLLQQRIDAVMDRLNQSGDPDRWSAGEKPPHW